MFCTHGGGCIRGNAFGVTSFTDPKMWPWASAAGCSCVTGIVRHGRCVTAMKLVTKTHGNWQIRCLHLYVIYNPPGLVLCGWIQVGEASFLRLTFREIGLPEGEIVTLLKAPCGHVETVDGSAADDTLQVVPSIYVHKSLPGRIKCIETSKQIAFPSLVIGVDHCIHGHFAPNLCSL